MKAVKSITGNACVREVLLWCLPAIILGVAVRLFMEIRMPYGYIQYDSADFLVTPYRLLSEHHYIIASKKAFLTPTFFAIPFFLHIPALLFIPITQHLMGLVEVVLAGALIRLWMPIWRWIIVPATVLIALSPWQLWYEQTLMGEANYVFFLFLVAWLGSLWALKPTWGRFAWLAVAIFCICGTRAEGKIMLLFGFALVPLVLWRNWKALAAAVLSLCAVYFVASLGGGGSHAFSLLYATLFQLTPDDIRSEPATAPYLIPLRDKTIQEGQYSTDLVDLAKRITDALLKYLNDVNGPQKRVKEQISDIERNLSVEILERRPVDVLMMPLVKFRLACDGWASGADFGQHALLEKQPQAVDRIGGMNDVLAPGLTGRKLDKDGMQQFVRDHYDPAKMSWFTDYERDWNEWSVAARLPDRPSVQTRWAHDFISTIPNADKVVPGVPVYFLLAFAGMIAAVCVRTELRWTQAAFLSAMIFTWYAATMVGVTNARFRFAYEPVCYMYDVAVIVWAAWGIGRLVRVKKEKAGQPICIAS